LREKPLTPAAYNPEITDECASLVLRLLAKDRKDRPRDFHEFQAAFRTTRLLKGEKIERPAM
jgi:hypothetical protein